MGLDIYAGTLTRYYTENWKNVVQQWAEAQGYGFQKITPQQDEDTELMSPEEIQEDIENWRDNIINNLKKGTNFNLQIWEENNEKDYYTNKPDWIGYHALAVFIAHKYYNESIPLMIDNTVQLHELPIFEKIQDDDSITLSILRFCQLWLPTKESFIFQGMLPTEEDAIIATTGLLQNELQRINELCWKADEETILSWLQTEGYPFMQGQPINLESSEENKELLSVESLAKLTFAIFYQACKYSLENNVPILLDY